MKRPGGTKPSHHDISGGVAGGDKKAAARPISAARVAAFGILLKVDAGRAHSDELLHTGLEGLSREDRNLTTALVMGVLRWQIALDAQLRRWLQRPGQRMAPEISIALRMGAFQLLHMDRIPAHAALSESVELCRAANQAHAAGMVNAVLRKVAAMERPEPKRIHEPLERLAERLGHPGWLVERWQATYGRDKALRICEADQSEHADGTMFLEKGAGLPQIDDGSRLVAELAAVAMPEITARNKRIWDCCAAPGGKTLMLALRHAEGETVASDVSPRRMKQMADRLRLHDYAAKVRCLVADAADAKEVEGNFDLILCDVPCSGTGTLAGNPEIRHRLKAEELERQAERQRRLLAGALKRLAPGGRLVYSTCSLEPEECQGVVERVVRGDYRAVQMRPLLERLVDQGILEKEVGIESMLAGEALRTIPGVQPCDGFYAVVLERARG